MAYHTGAELTNIECFQVNPLLKDYNGPACAYVSGPFGGYTVNAKGGHSASSGVWVNEREETTVPGLYAAGDMASVPHGYMLGAFTYGKIAGGMLLSPSAPLGTRGSMTDRLRRSKGECFVRCRSRTAFPPHQFEYKLRRHVNDYLQPPKSAYRLEKGLDYFDRAREELEQLGASDPHELMRATFELEIEKRAADPATEIVTYCGAGNRSALSTDNLRRMGHTNVKSLAGGLQAWIDAGFPTWGKRHAIED